MKIDIHTHILPKEWQNLKNKYGYGGWISLEHHKTGCARMMKDEYFFLGGIFNDSGCAIVTIESDRFLRNIHHRRPIFFSINHLDLWLNVDDQLLFESNPSDELGIHKVSEKVNSGTINDEKLLEPIY